VIFFWLALIALNFGLLGFLLHAMYFSKQEFTITLGKEIEDLRKKLASREEQLGEVREQISDTRILIHSLKRELKQSNGEMSALQRIARRQEEKIRLLQEKGETIRAAVAPPRQRQDDFGTTRSTAARPSGSEIEASAAILAVSQDHEGNERIAIEEGRGVKIPLWKENLDNILDMLDNLEKEEAKK
jgi:septal ring factor EnvC (AmiA/AmiB activator)